MINTNYFSGIVKVLETPKQHFINKQTLIITFRGEISQNRNNKIILIKLWGKLAENVKNFYQKNDYILIEGYISLKNKNSLHLSNKKSKQIIITVFRIYPILLTADRVTKLL